MKKIYFALFYYLPIVVFAEQFQPAITDTQWQVVEKPIVCRLTQPIADFGHAEFNQHAGKTFKLDFVTHSHPAKKGAIQFQIAEAPWQNSQQRQTLTQIEVESGQSQFSISGVSARQAFNHINEGRFPTIYYRGQHTEQEISVLMSTVHLQDYLMKFQHCLNNLIPYSFDDIRLLTVNFELEKAELGELEKAALDKLVRFVVADPSIRKVSISGHTDNHGRRRLNQELSDARAAVVKNYLINSGVIESLITVSSELEFKPLMSNKTQSGRAHNRRAEIKLFR